MKLSIPLAAALLAAGAVGPVGAQEAPTPPHRREARADHDLYGEASRRLHREQHAEALALFEALLEAQPQSPFAAEALFWRGHCLERLGRIEEARAAFQALIERHPDAGWAADARERLARATTPRPDPARFEVRLKNGDLLVTRVRRFGQDGVIIERGGDRGGEGAHLAWAEVERLQRLDGEVRPAQPIDTLTLQNGDLLSGVVVGGDPRVIVVEGPGFGHVELPRDRILRFEPAVALAGVEPAMRLDGGVYLLDDGAGADDAAPGETTTRQEADGSTTTVRTRPDGTTTTTTVSPDGKRIVIRRAAPGRPDGEQRRVVVRVDGPEGQLDVEADGVGVELLRDLPDAVRARVHGALRGPLGGARLRLRGPEGEVEREVELGRAREEVERALRRAREHLDRVPPEAREHVEQALRRAREELERAARQGERARDALRRLVEAHDGHGRGEREEREERHVFAFGGEPGQAPHVFGFSSGEPFLFRAEEVRPEVDRVVLDNGDVLSGEVLSMDERTLRLKAPYGEVNIDRRQVVRVTFRRQARGFLGVSCERAAEGGCAVTQVHAGTAAEQAGLRQGDVIVAVDGQPVSDAGQLSERLRDKYAGESVRLGVRRGQDQLELTVKLGERALEPARVRVIEGRVAPTPPRAGTMTTPPTPPAPPRAGTMTAPPPPPTPPTPPSPPAPPRAGTPTTPPTPPGEQPPAPPEGAQPF